MGNAALKSKEEKERKKERGGLIPHHPSYLLVVFQYLTCYSACYCNLLLPRTLYDTTRQRFPYFSTPHRHRTSIMASSSGKMMNAVRFHGKEDLRFEQVPEPECGKGQIKISLRGAGFAEGYVIVHENSSENDRHGKAKTDIARTVRSPITTPTDSLNCAHVVIC
jgi:hypothetical protein